MSNLQPDSSITVPDTQTPKNVVRLSDLTGYYSLETLTEINRSVNSSVTYERDKDKFGVEEFWEVAGARGDCEDYALLKLHKCLEAGIDISVLRLATCQVKTGEFHAVLFVNREGFTYVLDNIKDEPYRFIEQREYTWHSMQEVGGSKDWVKIPVTMI